jgi:hypothetical protein
VKIQRERVKRRLERVQDVTLEQRSYLEGAHVEGLTVPYKRPVRASA